MNIPKLAEALNTLSMAVAELREAVLDSPQAHAASVAGDGAAPAGKVPPATRSEPSPFEDEAVTWEPPDTLPTQDQGSEAVCPKHHVPFTAGAYGLYCKQATDDPAWGKQKGDRLWCKITPRNAAEYLRIKAAA